MSKGANNNYLESNFFVDTQEIVCNNAETDLLIREEARFLAKDYLIKQNFHDISIVDKNNNIDNNFNCQQSNQYNSSINEIKETLNENNNNLIKMFEKISNQISNAIEKQADVASRNMGKEDELLARFENLGNESIPLDENNNSLDSFENDNFFFQSDENNNVLNNLKTQQDFLLDQHDKISKELEIIKTSINDFVFNTSDANKIIFDETIINTNKLTNEVISVKNQYANIENEINKIFSTWLENNKLLENLENLLIELNDQKNELNYEKNDFNEEIYSKTLYNEKILDDLSIKSNDLKEMVEQLNERVAVIEDISAMNSKQQEEDEVTAAEIVDAIERINNRIKEFENSNNYEFIKSISKEVVDTELLKRNLFNNEDILTREQVVDQVMDSDIFNYSLEKKIKETIMEEGINANLSDDDKNEIVNLTINSDKIKNIIDTEVTYLSNDVKLDLNEKFTKLRDDFHNNNLEINSKIIELETKVESNNTSIKQHEIMELIFNSKELETIIENKLLYVVSDKLNELKDSVHDIETNILVNIRNYLDDELERDIKRDIIESQEIRQKIKNDALNAIYVELQERDKRFELQRAEILNNYEALIENNRILENLENLILRQVEEVEGFRRDKDSLFDLVVESINKQKIEINTLKEKIASITGKEFLNKAKTTNVSDNDIYQNVKNLTSNLVKNEIEKMNLIGNLSKDFDEYEIHSEIGINNFFQNRMKEIMKKLDRKDDEVIELDDVIPLTNELKVNFDDLKIDINELKEKSMPETVNNISQETVSDMKLKESISEDIKQKEEVNWFYDEDDTDNSENQFVHSDIDEELDDFLNLDTMNKEK